MMLSRHFWQTLRLLMLGLGVITMLIFVIGMGDDMPTPIRFTGHDETDHLIFHVSGLSCPFFWGIYCWTSWIINRRLVDPHSSK